MTTFFDGGNFVSAVKQDLMKESSVFLCRVTISSKMDGS